jgi:hypothetical protein
LHGSEATPPGMLERMELSPHGRWSYWGTCGRFFTADGPHVVPVGSAFSLPIRGFIRGKKSISEKLLTTGYLCGQSREFLRWHCWHNAFSSWAFQWSSLLGRQVRTRIGLFVREIGGVGKVTEQQTSPYGEYHRDSGFGNERVTRNPIPYRSEH